MLSSSSIRFLDSLKDGLVALGPFGAFLIALVDSFIPLPGGTDLAVVALSARQPALAPVTVMAAVGGSIVGSTIVYLGARRAGRAALSRVKPERRERVENLLGRYDVLAIAVAALLPPPFPFKVFNLSAGVFKLKVVRFVIAVGSGRLVRFAIEAALAVRYGDDAMTMIKQHGLIVFAAVLLLGVTVWLVRTLVARRTAAVED